MDYVSHFRREVRAFEVAIRRALALAPVPMVPSCPEWSAADLTAHLGGVHRYVSRILARHLTAEPAPADLTIFGLPADLTGWPMPGQGPHQGPPPPVLADWFAEGAAELAALFEAADAAEPAWTWSPADQSAGFWLRMQTIEAAVHRWDADGVFGASAPIDAELAADAVVQSVQVMAPARRAWRTAPAGAGERYRLRCTDGPWAWTVRFYGDEVALDPTGSGSWDVELAGTASDLMLHLWQRSPAGRLAVTGDRTLVERWFELVPPL